MAAVLAVAACSGGAGDDRSSAERGPTELSTAGLVSASLSEAGRDLAAGAGLDDWPEYRLDATIDPGTGEVAATMAAELPRRQGDRPMSFRVFPNLPALDAAFALDRVRVDGVAVEPELDRSLLTLPLPAGGDDDRVVVEMDFSYVVPVTDLGTDLLAGLAGNTLDPAETGLLGRHGGGLSLGHWFPVWLQPGAAAEPEPEGFGDIGNFPAARFSVRVEVPAGWQVFTGGTSTSVWEEDGRVVYQEEGVGLRDLALYAGRDLPTSEVDVDGVTVRVVARAEHGDVLAEVAEEAAASLEILALAFGPYPWSELDVIDVPLGSGVGGMEWPGSIWIETATFGGGVPGLGGLEGLLAGDGGLEELVGGEGGLAALLGGGALASLREFIVAHEVAHQWWHALVGNDSLTAPVVDEPLAQFSACHVLRTRQPEEGDELCAFHTEGQYQSLRALGQPDAPADQPTDAFSSALQYGAVIYGKAPGLYEELTDRFGEEQVLSALRSYVEAHPFSITTPGDLRAALRRVAPTNGGEEVDALWSRWIEGAHGDQDIGTGSGGLLGATEGMEGLESGELGRLQELLAMLLEGMGQ